MIELSDGGNRFSANQLITLYKDDDTTDPSNIIQIIQYHSSCSQELKIGDTFGSVQLFSFQNEDQGVSALINQTVVIQMSANDGFDGLVQIMAVRSNRPPYFYHLGGADGRRVPPADLFTMAFDVPTDDDI
jgi:hypothetical protein